MRTIAALLAAAAVVAASAAPTVTLNKGETLAQQLRRE